uniref:Uncharacterized protein n=1 Tax=Caenorhabditis angaria TaxID=860376 RepID=B6VBZ8_9PELO|nr:hypothetical protein Csp3_JD06.007 [Caenorhabditis angaria]
MSARLLENEYFGLVTREECDEKRDLRLVSSRDFPRDVRIFKSGTHCCHPSEKVAGKSTHDHLKCVQIGVNNVHLLGKSIAMKMKKCHGMGVSSQNNNNNNLANNNNKTYGEEHQEQESSSSSPSILNNSEGQHVNGRSLRENVTQLSVTVHGGFVEIETISEYSGLTDHNGFPLLWSHDLMDYTLSKLFVFIALMFLRNGDWQEERQSSNRFKQNFILVERILLHWQYLVMMFL